MRAPGDPLGGSRGTRAEQGFLPTTNSVFNGAMIYAIRSFEFQWASDHLGVSTAAKPVGHSGDVVANHPVWFVFARHLVIGFRQPVRMFEEKLEQFRNGNH